MRRILTFIFISIILVIAAVFVFIYFTPTEKYLKKYPTPKFEMRAVWISTFMNVDWPTSTKISQQEQLEQLISQIDIHEKNKMNTLIFQVRPSADAFYSSPHEPWSQWLTGKQGKAPDPFYDPLQLVIDEAHKRNMELHAWFNPYRAMMDTSWMDQLDSSNIILQKPEWFVAYGRGLYFNPGIPEVKNYIIKIVLDVVRRYNIDAVHFDDYFYPYKIPKLEFDDAKAFEQYRGAFAENQINDWRRNNVNSLIKAVSDSIKHIKPFLKFGISPFGVWRNSDVDFEGTKTQAGQPSYDATYADTKLWMQKGWIDYITPQIYWHIGHERADFEEITNWWTRNHFKRHLYIGHGIYKVNKDADEKQWRSAKQIIDQIQMVRNSSEIRGSMYFSSIIFQKDPKRINSLMQNTINKYPALIPPMPWIDSIPPDAPLQLKSENNEHGIVMSWKIKREKQETNKLKYFVVYRFRGDKALALNNSNIYSIQTTNKIYFIQRFSFLRFLYKDYTFVVTAVDYQNNESEPSDPLTIQIKP